MEEIYIDFARYNYVALSEEINILTFKESLNLFLSLSSWVPDWTIENQIPKSFSFDNPHCSEHKSTKDWAVGVPKSDKLHILRRIDWKIDIIQKLENKGSEINSPAFDGDQWSNIIEDATRHNRGIYWPTLKSTQFVLWRTRLADVTNTLNKYRYIIYHKPTRTVISPAQRLNYIWLLREKPDAFNCRETILEETNRRRLIISAGNYIGMAQFDVRSRDEIFLFIGSKVRLVLKPYRKKGGPTCYRFIAEYYVQEIINNEFFNCFNYYAARRTELQKIAETYLASQRLRVNNSIKMIRLQ